MMYLFCPHSVDQSSNHSFYKICWSKNGKTKIREAFFIACNNAVAVNRFSTDGSKAVLKVRSSMRKGFFYVTTRHIGDTNNRKELFNCLIASLVIM